MEAQSSSTEEVQSDKHEIQGTALGTQSYWDTDDDDNDHGQRPHELYGTFTWMVNNFSQLKTETRTDPVDIGGCKWCLLLYPQGLHASDNLSVFLCIANHDKLLPGWSHYAQFTLSLLNRDNTKSKLSDTLHRFWKKEPDWGWRKYIELSKLPNGFVNDDMLTIRAQIQVIREMTDRPFRCLDGLYRMELMRVYLSNLEAIVRRFTEETERKLRKLLDDKTIWLSLTTFWQDTDQSMRRNLTRENAGIILRALVKSFFVEKEVTSTLMMDSLYAGLKVLKQQGRNKEGMAGSKWLGTTPMVIFDQDEDMFILADDGIFFVENAALFNLESHQPILPWKNDTNSERYSKDRSISEQGDRRLVELGWKALEVFIVRHFFSQIEVAHQEASDLKLKDEHITGDQQF